MAYRDEQEAARIRCESLRRELEEIDRHLASARAVAARRAVLAAELEQTSRTLDRGASGAAEPAVERSALRLLRDVGLAALTVTMLGTTFLSVAGGAAYLVSRERARAAYDMPPPIAAAFPAMEPPAGDS